MAIHIYMSTKKGTPQPDGSIALAPDAQMNYRGEAGPNDDPQAFKRRMSGLGYVVVFTEERLVEAEVTPDKREGRPQQAPHVRYSDLMLEA